MDEQIGFWKWLGRRIYRSSEFKVVLVLLALFLPPIPVFLIAGGTAAAIFMLPWMIVVVIVLTLSEKYKEYLREMESDTDG